MFIRFVFFLLLPCVLAALSEQPHHTTAFIGVPSKFDFLLTYSNYSTKHFWNGHGKKLKTFNDFDRNAFLIYGEYALNCRNSFTVNAGYQEVKESLNGSSYGFEDVELGWKHLFYSNEASAFTTDLIAIIPAGDKKSSIRYGKFGGQLSLLYSTYFCLAGKPGWIDLSAGYRVYQGFPSDQVRASLAVGYFFKSWLQAIVTSQLECGVGNGESRRNLNRIAFHPNYRLLKTKIEGVARLLPWASLSAGGFWHLWGENVGAGGGYFVGAWIDF